MRLTNGQVQITVATRYATNKRSGSEEELILAKIKNFLGEMGLEKEYNPSQTIDKFFSILDSFEKKVEKHEKEVIQKDIKTKHNKMFIVPLYDVHLGAKTCLKDLFAKTISYIYETPDCYTILGGDIMESATRQSVGLGMIDENLHLTDQMKVVKKLLKPLVDQGKVLGAVTGKLFAPLLSN